MNPPVITFPCLAVKMVPADNVVANEYNPNKVASVEMELLAVSIEEDGVTQPIVTVRDDDNDRWVVVDGFHRWTLLKHRWGCPMVPVVVIDKPLAERMASTVRHNRARGKHQVDLQAMLVKTLAQLGKSDDEIARDLGMSEDEILRLKQIVGAARMLAAEEYSSSYGRDDEPDDV